eukprot:1888682-Pleurochrysis_carterae.AAC.2
MPCLKHQLGTKSGRSMSRQWSAEVIDDVGMEVICIVRKACIQTSRVQQESIATRETVARGLLSVQTCILSTSQIHTFTKPEVLYSRRIFQQKNGLKKVEIVKLSRRRQGLPSENDGLEDTHAHHQQSLQHMRG